MERYFYSDANMCYLKSRLAQKGINFGENVTGLGEAMRKAIVTHRGIFDPTIEVSPQSMLDSMNDAVVFFVEENRLCSLPITARYLAELADPMGFDMSRYDLPRMDDGETLQNKRQEIVGTHWYEI